MEIEYHFLFTVGNHPAPIDLKGPFLPGSRVSSLPIAVIAANRPHYLFRMLRGLLTTPGVDPKMVTVYIDGFFDEPAAIAELFKVPAIEHTPVCSKNCRISQVMYLPFPYYRVGQFKYSFVDILFLK